MKSDLSLWKEMPLPFRVFFVVFPLLGLGFMGFVVWAIWRLVTHLTTTP